jgi:Helicase conserved C-terminal domain
MSGPTRFQKRTAAYVIKRFWEDVPPARRFLVADEVGLGKTVVAREVIAEALRGRGSQAIDIVYLCSSQPVASQNLKRLVHEHIGAARATRLTLLATEPLSKDKVRYFALTPDTSFKVTGRAGHVRERALIFWCLRRHIRRHGFREMMQQVSDASWNDRLNEFSQKKPNSQITEAFAAAVLEDQALVEEIREFASEAADTNAASPDFKRRRNQIIGRLRKELAVRSAEALASNGLIIVDEFQRFSHLFDIGRVETDFGVKLADRLLTDTAVGRRVLLLSATPYRLPGGSLAPGEKPYADFVGLVHFLAGQNEASAVENSLDRFARALRSHPPKQSEVTAARDEAQAILCKVMSRTERTGSTKKANAMVAEDVRSLATEREDLDGAIAARRVARRLKTHDPVEYWKSAPYFLDFMREYQFRTAAAAATGSARRFVAREASRGSLLLDLASLRRLEPISIPSARLRDLIRDAAPIGAERLLWVTPSLSYVRPEGLFAEAAVDVKRLILTEWRLAPDAISAMVSYEMEQRLAADLRGKRQRRTRRNNRELGQRHKRFSELGDLMRLGRPDRSVSDPTLGMAPLALLLSGARLGALGDPLSIALAAGGPIERTTLLEMVRKNVVEALRALGRSRTVGRIDERWYWAAFLLLEDRRAVERWLATADPFLSDDETGTFDVGRVQDAIQAILEDPGLLGRRPRDLALVVARLAVGSPGMCAYRALSRTARETVSDSMLRRSAFHIARGFQTLFNQAETTAAVQLQFPGIKRVYWSQVLDYCIDGNLQALLDEQLHFEVDGLSMFEGTEASKLEKAARAVHASLTLRRASIEVRGLKPRRRNKSGQDTDVVRLRCRHALRFAEIKEADGTVSRLDAIRAAFNSPFRPFLLASTTVGQEGLDFHPWCHAVVHWNLPRSPVELEQREGRVHRYKGHAVRLNVARGIGIAGLAAAGAGPDADPWRRMFELAAEQDEGDDLAPCWVYEHCVAPVQIKRIVPVLTWSREYDAWPRLRDRLATYRLVMGMPRQDDLLETLERNGITPEQALAWKIDLAPPKPQAPIP